MNAGQKGLLMRIIIFWTLFLSLAAGLASAQEIAFVLEPQAMTKAIESVGGWMGADESTPRDLHEPFRLSRRSEIATVVPFVP